MKKKILLALSFLTVIGLSIGGTVAYFTAQDAEVATFAYGDVNVKQFQYERIVDENGKWISTDVEDQYGYTPDKIQKITTTQGSPVLPAVYQDGNLKWDDRINGITEHSKGAHNQSWAQAGALGSNQLFDDSIKNVVDRFTFIKNTGKNDAYVRTWVAFEKGNIDVERYDEIIHSNINTGWWDITRVIENYVIIDEETGKTNTYYVMCLDFLGEDGTKRANGDTVLRPGSITRPSLLQFFLDPTTTGEELKAMDGNGNGQFDVITITQAVQADGFENATKAFEEAFKDNLPF